MSFTWTWGHRPTDNYSGFYDVKINAGSGADTNYYESGLPDPDNFQLKYGGATSDFTRQMLIKVDMSPIETFGLTVETATLYAYIISDEQYTNNQIQIYRCGRAEWAIDTVTWNKYDGVNDWDTSGEALVYHERVDAGTPDWLISSGSNGTEPEWKSWTSAEFNSYVQDVIDGNIQDPAGYVNLIMFGWENKNFTGRTSRYLDDTSLRPYLEIQFAGDPPSEGGATGRAPQSFLGFGVGI